MNSLLERHEQSQIDSWINGVSHEVSFWNTYLNKKRRKILMDSFQKKEQFSLTMLGLHEMGVSACNAKEYVALDVGCGMSFLLKPYVGENAIDLHYVDPLAVFYNKIITKKKLNHLPVIQFAFVEYLSSFFNANSVNLIVIQNALDHSFDPVKGIVECVRVLTKGGILYLAHRRNEAEYESYRGFHQYNIDTQDDDLVIWNKGHSENINKLLAGIANIQIDQRGAMIFAKITKVLDIENVNDNVDKELLCRQLIYMIDRLSDTKFTLSFHITKIWLFFFYFFANIVPAAFKKRVKLIIRRAASA